MRSRALVISMNEQELRELFTDIGCIMEDASVTALVWTRDVKVPLRIPAALDRSPVERGFSFCIGI